MKTITLTAAIVFASLLQSSAQSSKPRARDLGISFDGITGKNNSITDVKGVLVGYKTIIKGDAKQGDGKDVARTGVTVIFPNGRSIEPVPAGWFCLNGPITGQVEPMYIRPNPMKPRMPTAGAMFWAIWSRLVNIALIWVDRLSNGPVPARGTDMRSGTTNDTGPDMPGAFAIVVVNTGPISHRT